MLLVLLLLAGLAGVARAAFPQDPPNDPQYAPAEQVGSTQCVDDEQWPLFSFIPRCTPLASDADGASGMSVDAAWRQFTTGDPGVTIAYVEAGINWRYSRARDLVDKVFLNRGELPLPELRDGHVCARYDCNGDGVFNVEDYAQDPRVHRPYVNGYLTPEDLIVAFGDCRVRAARVVRCRRGAHFDNDHNGYPNDISGWDFYDNQNDPATTDTAYQHSDEQMAKAAAATDNGFGGAGVCPRCMILPIKAGAEALDRGPDLAQAWLYAVDMGAPVVISETAELGYTTFAKQAADYAYRHGTVIVESANDFNSTDHQGGMYHPHVLPGNALVPNMEGTQALTRETTTFRERSSISSWGDHNVFSVPAVGGTTSAADPELAGAVALVVAYGRRLKPALSAPEAVQVLRETVSPIDDPGLSWPGGPGWTAQYGYGRPDLPRALAAVRDGALPPVAAIDSPDWFALYDPVSGPRSVPVLGHIDGARTPSFSWRLEMGLGSQPAAWRTIGTGRGSRSFSGRLGTLRMSDVPRSFWSAPFALSQTKELETSEQYTVTLRLQVSDTAGRTGEDRRAVSVEHDPTAYPGFPMRVGSGAGGESQAALVDLQGRGRLDIVFGTSDGWVHAIDPATRRELPGWPVHTRAVTVLRHHAGVAPGYEPVVGDVAVGDLEGDGDQEVVATTLYGRVYVWNADGAARRGFPHLLATGVITPPIPRPSWPMRRLPRPGALAAPVLGPLLPGRRGLEIIQAGWDGRLHVLLADGRPAPGWPVRVALPADYAPPSGDSFVDDEKLEATPALARLQGGGGLDVVERSQQTDPGPGPVGTPARGHVFAFDARGRPVPGWPVALQGVAEDYGSAQEFVTEGSDNPVAADVDGSGLDSVAVNTVLSPGYLLGPDGSVRATYGPLPDATASALSGGLDPAAAVSGRLPSDAPVDFTTTGAFGMFGGALTFAQAGSGSVSIASVEEFPGLGLSILNSERAWGAASGASVPGFPSRLQGLDFIGAPLFADVTGSGSASIIDGGDSNAMHAFGAGGAQAPGFPKFTTGWTVFSPSAGDLDGRGRVSLVSLTREGELFVWRTPGLAAGNQQWWRWHHDEWSSGLYGLDTRPPGAVRHVRLVSGGRALSFVAPGGDWYDGRAARYVLTVNGRERVAPRPAVAGALQRVRLPAGARTVTLLAVDQAGNLGVARSFRLTRGRLVADH